MSISSLDLINQTTLVPQTLLGYSSNGVSALEITPTSITIAGDLNTTPIYVEISALGGLTTTNPTGLNVNCDFNMNDNNITNLNEIIGTTDLTLTGSDIYTNTQGLQLNAGSFINLDCNVGNINLITQSNSGEIYITSGASIHLNPNNGNGGTTNIVNGLLVQSFNVNGLPLDNCNTINTSNGFVLNDTGGGVVLNSAGDMVLNAPNGKTYISLTSVNPGDGELVCSTISSAGGSSLTLNSADVDINLTAPTGKINANSDIVMKDATEPTWDTKLEVGGLSFNLPIGSDTNSIIIDAEGSSTIVCQIANVIGTNSTTINPYQIQFDGGGINTTLTPTAISTNDNFSVQTNGTTGLINLNTGELFNGGGIKWNGYPMGITFFNKWDGGFNYSTGGTWEMVKQNSITFPPSFLYGTWAVQFSINCSNVGSAPADKGLAMYFSFIDGGSNTYNGFSYNQNFPFANWFNASGYVNTSQTPLSITYTDYFDFNNATNNLELQINWFADNPQSQNSFIVSTTFTLMTLI